jgi:hypothetical protein
MRVHRPTRAKRRTAVLAACAALVLGSLGPAARADDGPTVLLHDDFSAGFDSTRWGVQSAGDLPSGDGVVSTSPAGLLVVPTGTNPVTGLPAFAATDAPDAPAGGTADHVKWLAFPLNIAPSGYPGFAVPATGSLNCAITMSATATGLDQQPFGAAVPQPQSDVRLAAADLVMADFESDAVFDISLTNTEIYAVYERLRAPGSSYAAYSYAIPVARRTPGELDALRVRVGEGGTRVSWFVNGREVLTTGHLGYRVFPRRFMLLDHGGTEQSVAPRQLTCGMGTFTVLDAAGADGRALVKLDSTPDFYYSTRLGAPVPQTFLDPQSLTANRIWGQGEILRVRSVDISTEP